MSGISSSEIFSEEKLVTLMSEVSVTVLGIRLLALEDLAWLQICSEVKRKVWW